MVGCYEAGRSYAMQVHVFAVCYTYGWPANWQQLEDAARQVTGAYPMVPGLSVQHSLLRGSYVDDEMFSIIVRADKAINIERPRIF